MVFANSAFGEQFGKGETELETARTTGTNLTLAQVFVGDAAFPLDAAFPYSGRGLDLEKATFHYRLSRARRVVENTFVILAARNLLPANRGQ